MALPLGYVKWNTATIVDGNRITRANGADSLTDSKRAAVMFGVGQYLYGCDAPWVEVDERRQIKASQMPKLHAVLRKMDGTAQISPARTPQICGVGPARYSLRACDRLRHQ